MSLAGNMALLGKIAGCSLRGRPLNSSTEIRLTRLCSQRCRQCGVYSRRTKPASLDIERFRHIAERLRQYGAYQGMISGGEPLLIPDLEEILLEAKKTFSVAVTLVTGLYHRPRRVEQVARVALENDINIQTSLDGLGPLGDDLRGVANFSATVTDRMRRIARMRASSPSKSLLYANIVLNNKNLHQVPELLETIADCGWQATVGFYHHLTETTRVDEELSLQPGPALNRVLEQACQDPRILTLRSFLRGIGQAARKNYPRYCAYLDAPVLSTRTVIMENGEVYLCRGGPIGNVFQQDLAEIFTGPAYRKRLEEYRSCPGCWTSCYAQRYLLFHPPSFDDLLDTLLRVYRVRQGFQLLRRAKK
ncbi:radical SAM protein [Candidatus Zixiibacteriota bacterium]